MRLPTISRRNAAAFVLLFACTLPLLVLSLDVAGSILRDNANYFRFYDAILGGFRGNPFEFYSQIAPRAREPFSFAYLYLFASAGAPYVVAILFKNMVLLWALYRLMIRYLGLSPIGLLFVAYISTDYYVFGLMSEFQRLSTAVTVLLLLIGVSWRKQAIGFLIACLFHFQVALLAPLVMMTKHWKVGLLLSAALAPILLYVAWDKIVFYFDPELDDALKFAAVTVLFGGMAFLFGERTIKLWLLLSVGLGAAAITLGTDRVIIFYWETLMLAFFIEARKCGPWSARKAILATAVIAIMIPYNLWRVSEELVRLEYWAEPDQANESLFEPTPDTMMETL